MLTEVTKKYASISKCNDIELKQVCSANPASAVFEVSGELVWTKFCINKAGVFVAILYPSKGRERTSELYR